MRRVLALYRSLLGKKLIVAVTGVLWLGFLLGHVAGNLKVFLPDTEAGQPDIDYYGAFLRSMGEPLLPHAFGLWTVRVVLLVCLVLHVVCVIQLAGRSAAARPHRYRQRRLTASTHAARMMMVSGALVLAFLVFHILHLTVGSVQPSRFEEGQVYANLSRAFNQGLFAVLYVVAMALVAFHLFHGIWSFFQTLGWDHPDRNRLLRRLALVLAVALFVGFASVPVAFYSGSLPSRGAAPAGAVAEVE